MARKSQGRGGSGKGKPRRPKEEPPSAGVLVTVQEDGEGNQKIQVAPIGGTKQTELPTLLGIARRLKEEDLGIREGR